MTTTSRITTFVLLSLVLVASAWGQPSRVVTDTVDLDPAGGVEIEAQAGSIHVQPWDRSAVGIQVRIEGESSEQLNDTEVTVRKKRQSVIISPEGEDVGDTGFFELLGMTSYEGPKTYYTVRMPRTASLHVRSESAAVEIAGLKGDVTIEGGASPVTLRKVHGDATVATFSGSLTVDDTRGAITFATFSGDATGRLKAIPDDSQFASFSGDVLLTLPADAAFDLRTDVSWGGSVSTDFDGSDASPGEKDVRSFGGGGPLVQFESFSGSLQLRAE